LLPEMIFCIENGDLMIKAFSDFEMEDRIKEEKMNIDKIL
jgi:hypothetical protein